MSFNGQQQKFEVRYNPDNPERSSFVNLDGLGFGQICGPKDADGLWPVKLIDGFKRGEVSFVPENELGTVSRKNGDLDKCYALIGARAPERRPFQQRSDQNQRPQQVADQRPQANCNRDGRPYRPNLIVKNPPFGIRARFVLQNDGRMEFQTSHDDPSVLAEVTPAIVYKGDQGNHPVRNERGQVIRTWSHLNWEVVWLDREGKEIVVGTDAENLKASSDDNLQ